MIKISLLLNKDKGAKKGFQSKSPFRKTLEQIIQKACHNPAILFKIKDRGFIREGYFADLVLVDINDQFLVVLLKLILQFSL